MIATGILRPLMTSILRGSFPGGGGGGGLSALRADARSLWTLDDKTGGLLDLIGTNHMTESGTVTANPGKVNGGIESSHKTPYGYMICATTSGIYVDGSFYTSGWMNPALAQNAGISGGNGLDQGYYLYRAGDYLMFQTRDAAGITSTYLASATFTVGTWVHFIAYYDASRAVSGIIINNGTASEIANLTGGHADTGPTFIGFTTSIANPNRTIFDEVGVYAGTLTPEKIAALWNGGAGVSNADIAAA